MELTIKKWGNSLATRFPKAIVEQVGLQLDQQVQVQAVAGNIVIKPIRKTPKYSLEELLEQCPPEKMELSPEDEEWLNAPAVGEEL